MTATVYSYIQDNACVDRKTRPLEQGEALYVAGLIGNCTFEGQNIEARCIASKISAAPHEIQIQFADYSDYRQWNCVCSCKAGAGGKCKHIVATLLYVYNAQSIGLLSCTDVPQAWGKRKREELVEVVPVEQFCHVKSSEHSKSDMAGIIPEDFVQKCFEVLPNSGAAMLFKGTINPEDRSRDDLFSAICDNAYRSELTEVIYQVNIDTPLRRCCVATYNKLYPCDGFEICKDTFKSKATWMQERQYRITGSRCYTLFTYSQGDWHTKAVKYFYPKSFKGTYATRYGNNQEDFARQAYMTNLPSAETVIQCGLIVCQKNPWLACSPDGIVFRDKRPIRLLEIKCPVLGAKKTITECLPSLEYMEFSEGEGWTLKRRHGYMAQIQLSLAILNLLGCDFIIYSSFDRSFYLLNIDRDEIFCNDLLKKLKSVFFQNMLHVLCEPL
ncbi:hypothetical protein Zmor_007035 [Zophobas morio]|uniref:SWIM-type domain-containing protein n=1 Tax=Zophobas morio TaxID=2755281 RepID=A0AA38ISY4_9CUCU|nr:hypothetical protein Zmor_007035 [Zophobas morio]